MFYEFKNDGKSLLINTPKTPRNWANYLFNNGYYTEVSQTLQGKSVVLDPVEREFTKGYRFFYIKDKKTGEVFSVNYAPLKNAYDKYECIHSLTYTELVTEINGIRSSIKIFVPTSGTYEYIRWSVSSETERELELYTVIGTENNGMGITCEYEDCVFSSLLFPYHIRYTEYEFAKSQKSYSFMIADRNADRHIGSEFLFWGCEDRTEVPAFVVDETIKSQNTYGDTPPVFACGYNVALKSDKAESLTFMVGVAHNKAEINSLKEKISDFDKEAQKAEERYYSQADNAIIKTPDKTFNYMMNNWIKKQTLCMSQTHRKTVFVCTRNELQDCVGLSVLNPKEGVDGILKVYTEQYESGYVQQHHTYNSVLPPQKLGVLKHMDGAVWLILCTCFVMDEVGSADMLKEVVKYKDSELEETIYEHLMRAINFMKKNHGIHGLCLLGDGDWTDPINGAGRFGKGESVWTTLAYIAALKEFRKFADKCDIENIDEQITFYTEAINKHAWADDRFIAGYDDDGKPFGCEENEYGKLYLNPQTWAIIAGVCDDKLDKVKEAIKKTKTPIGNRLLIPAYPEWDAQVGKISVKTAGTTENGSVYNHASMFKAYADFLTNCGDDAYETIMSALPTNEENPPEKNLQVPLFVSNFYYGLDKPNFGQSSNSNYTGTCAWMLWLATDFLLGAKATVEGIVLNPQLPSSWNEASLIRKFKDAVYEIEIVRGEDKGIMVDDEKINGILLPYENGKTYKVRAII